MAASAAQGIDASFMPVGAQSAFPAGTSKVYCWIEWKDAGLRDQLVARWIFEKSNSLIFEYPVPLPIAAGSGGIALSMPGGKSFPAGNYRVDFTDVKGDVLKSVLFSVA